VEPLSPQEKDSPARSKEAAEKRNFDMRASEVSSISVPRLLSHENGRRLTREEGILSGISSGAACKPQ
jgi:cysteine synthase